MTIGEAQEEIKTQILLKKTTSGRPLSDQAILTLDSTLADVDNFDNEALECPGCQMVYSILFSSNGCPNCGCIAEVDSPNEID